MASTGLSLALVQARPSRHRLLSRLVGFRLVTIRLVGSRLLCFELVSSMLVALVMSLGLVGWRLVGVRVRSGVGW